MNRAITVNNLRPVIDSTYEFVNTAAAFKHMESGSHFGKVVVKLPTD